MAVGPSAPWGSQWHGEFQFGYGGVCQCKQLGDGRGTVAGAKDLVGGARWATTFVDEVGGFLIQLQTGIHEARVSWKFEKMLRFSVAQGRDLTPDVVMVSSLIKACDAARNWQAAVQLLELMRFWHLHLDCMSLGGFRVGKLESAKVIKKHRQLAPHALYLYTCTHG